MDGYLTFVGGSGRTLNPSPILPLRLWRRWAVRFIYGGMKTAVLPFAVALSVALGGAAAPVPAVAGDLRLERLFHDLRAAPTDAAADPIESEIWSIWLDHPAADVLSWMREGVERLRADSVDDAIACFDRVVAADPDYAEGWNKRANAHYLRGDFTAAVADIRRTLALEPRHFAALAGLGLVYMAVGQPQGALRAFEAALAINPHLALIRDQVDALRRQVAGVPL